MENMEGSTWKPNRGTNDEEIRSKIRMNSKEEKEKHLSRLRRRRRRRGMKLGREENVAAILGRSAW